MVLTESFQKLKKGDRASDFRLKGVDGREYSLVDFQGKNGLPRNTTSSVLRTRTPKALEVDIRGLLVIFMCNHCPYVLAKIPAILELHKKWGDRISFVGINSNDPEFAELRSSHASAKASAYEGEGMENMKIFAKEQGIKFPYLLDETQETAKTYGATCTPDPFLFNKDLQLVFHGRIDDAMGPGEVTKEHTMDENISKMLVGQEISDELKPSVGCSIKWKQ